MSRRRVLRRDGLAACALRKADGTCWRCGGRSDALLAVKERNGSWRAECFRRDQCDERIRRELRERY